MTSNKYGYFNPHKTRVLWLNLKSSPVFKWVDRKLTSAASLLFSKNFSSESNQQDANQLTLLNNGQASKQCSKLSTTTPSVSVVSAKELNTLHIELIGELTEFIRREHREFARLHKSFQERSLKEGHNHYRAILRPDIMIDRLIEAGILPEECKSGRVDLAGTSYLKRTGLNTQLAFLSEQEEAIKVFLEDHTDYDPVEGYNILCAGVVLNGLAGQTKMASALLTRIGERSRALPSTRERNRVFSEANYILSLAAAA